MITSRRSFLTGAAAFIAAPAIVKAANLMPVRGVILSYGDSIVGQWQYSPTGEVLDRWAKIWGLERKAWINPIETDNNLRARLLASIQRIQHD